MFLARVFRNSIDLVSQQKVGSPVSEPHVSTRPNTGGERARRGQDAYEFDSLGAALPPELPAGPWNLRAIAASLPYLRPVCLNVLLIAKTYHVN